MHEFLETAADRLGSNFSNLRSAADETERALAIARREVRTKLQEYIGDRAFQANGLDIYAFGSIARAEMGLLSDFDYVVSVNSIDVKPGLINHYREAALDAHRILGKPAPGVSGLFGGAISAPNLVNVIGLNEDSNLNMSHRILMLQESVALNPHDEREKNLMAILNRYLLDYVEKKEPLVPRFLLNDIVRFWRTVAVDYQAKRWQELRGEKWGLRYIKLRSSRKWSFAGNLLALFMPTLTATQTTAQTLMAEFAPPPLARLAQLTEVSTSGGETQSALKSVLEIADWFLGRFNQDAWRNVIKEISNPAADDNDETFNCAQRKTVDLQEALQGLFFSEEILTSGVSLGQLTKKYLSF